MLIKVTSANGTPHAERADDSIFTLVADGDPIPETGAIIVSLKCFIGCDKPLLLTRDAPLGVIVQSGEQVESLGECVHRLALVVLNIPYFRDGRAFSSARILRTRMQYKGDIQITGHFLRDQIAFFVRVGANLFDCRENLSVADVDKALNEISVRFQPAEDGRVTVPELRHDRP